MKLFEDILRSRDDDGDDNDGNDGGDGGNSVVMAVSASLPCAGHCLS